MAELIQVVSRRTGQKRDIPRAWYESHKDLFKLPPSARSAEGERRPKAAPKKNTAKPANTAATTDTEAADGATT